MIREERDIGFWQGVVSDPFVAEHALWGEKLSQGDLASTVGSDYVIPLASEHGGYWFIQRDPIGRSFELHSFFTRKGRGREAMFAAIEAFSRMFAKGMQVLTTYEVDGNPFSRPPKGFGFAIAGDFSEVSGRMLRPWILTQHAWECRPSRLGMN